MKWYYYWKLDLINDRELKIYSANSQERVEPHSVYGKHLLKTSSVPQLMGP